MLAVGSREGIVCDFDFASGKAGYQMQMICNFTSYAEKWVPVNLVDSLGVRLQLERKHDSICICCFWAVLRWGQSS